MNYSQFLFYLGGTTDIVVQEKLKDGKLKYLCKSSGEKCGGTNVDFVIICFAKFIKYIYGSTDCFIFSIYSTLFKIFKFSV
jgi:hypothetical protein